MSKKIQLHDITFTGPHAEAVGLHFGGKPRFIYGASNTGKSFALKALNFMLGAQAKELPNIDERAPYDTCWLGLNLPTDGDVTLSRATKGGDFALQSGFVDPSPTLSVQHRILGGRHDDENPDSLSRYLLDQLGFGKMRLAKNASGQTIALSFRHLIRYCLVDETSIQATRSPIASLRTGEDQLDRSIFRFLLTGQDDSAIQARATPTQFKASKQARLATIDDLIADIDKEIAETEAASGDATADFEEALAGLRQTIEAGRASVREQSDERFRLVRTKAEIESRLSEVRAHLGRFSELEKLYTSDIQRLEAIEEAGFLLNLGSERDCPLCGASPEHQHASHGTDQVNAVRTAALAEIEKIKALRAGLAPTIDDLSEELSQTEATVSRLDGEIRAADEQMLLLSTRLQAGDADLTTLMRRRDAIQKLIRLQEQRSSYVARRDAYNKLKQSRKEKIVLTTPDNAVHELCQVISSILTEWQFPGERHVSFDPIEFDLRIDGKLRTDNGKGVRALTHAAFKLGVMKYCHDRALPHPGFIVLDSPLLTYRDPVKNPKHGDLDADEQALAQTTVRERFFEHLATLKDVGQIIVFDNIDPPSSTDKFAKPELFSKSSAGRYGFFPPV